MFFEENKKEKTATDYINAVVGLFAIAVVAIAGISLYRAMNAPERLAASYLSRVDFETLGNCVRYGGGKESCSKKAIAEVVD